MKKYSVEYWLDHYKHAMGHKDKSVFDQSNVEWTRKIIEHILDNQFPHGMSGTNINKALILYMREFHPNKEHESIKLMHEYLESIKQRNALLIKC